MDPKDVHTLVLGACEYVTSHGERNFADVIKVMDLEMRTLSWIIGIRPF